MVNVYWTDDPDINWYGFYINGEQTASIIFKDHKYVFSGYMPTGYYETRRKLYATNIEDAKSEFLNIYKDEIAESIKSMEVSIKFKKELLNQL